MTAAEAQDLRNFEATVSSEGYRWSSFGVVLFVLSNEQRTCKNAAKFTRPFLCYLNACKIAKSRNMLKQRSGYVLFHFTQMKSRFNKLSRKNKICGIRPRYLNWSYCLWKSSNKTLSLRKRPVEDARKIFFAHFDASSIVSVPDQHEESFCLSH